MNVTIKLRCPLCFQKIACGDDFIGQKVTCPSCTRKVKIPAPNYNLGTEVNGFILEQWLGSGAMGEVHLARQIGIDRLVAIKIIPKENLSDEEDRMRFVMEAKNLAKLNHPNIVTAIQAGEFEGGAYLAMSYIEGITVEDKIDQEGRLTETDALRVCEQIADALEHAWDDYKIIHRDLKPANFMIDTKNNFHLMDMGIAKSVENDMALTAVGIVMGTPFYMSPEQARGKKDIDFRSDIYSLGASLYNMVTGHPPFDEGSSSTEVMSVKLHNTPKNPRKYNAKISKEMCTLISIMMHIDPEKRPKSWSEVKKLIKKVRLDRKNKKSKSGSQAKKSLERSLTNSSSNVHLYLLSALTVIFLLVIVFMVVKK
ncbi:MAG: serine/threonine protein kinase [Lentisphaeraceae bacterium]|nr:serine/threonine protein kinase [Lentisphaeraceae bacterium]